MTGSVDELAGPEAGDEEVLTRAMAWYHARILEPMMANGLPS